MSVGRDAIPPASPEPEATSEPEASSEAKARSVWLRWLPLALLACASVGVLVSGLTQLVDVDRLLASRAWLRAAVEEDRARAVAVAALAYVCAVVVSVPATLVLTVFCGFLFGTVTGALVAIGSATTGASIVFAIGRNAARDVILRRAGPRLGRFAAGFRHDAFGYVAFLRLLPIFPFWMTNLLPAVFGVRLRTFALATLIGLTPGAFVYAATGAGIEEAVAAHEAAKAECLARSGIPCELALELRRLITPTTLAALMALAVFALLTIVLRRWFERPAAGA